MTHVCQQAIRDYVPAMKIAIPETLPQTPFPLVTYILEKAKEHIFPNPLAMVLATADSSGKPSSRTVLLKHFDENGFIFFSNSQSRKGRQIQENPFAGLTFYLGPLGVQIQVEGNVCLIPPHETDKYWQTRPRESQIGAWASAQSRIIPPDDTFEERVRQFHRQFQAESHIPRPNHWNGYGVRPYRIELWFEGDFRLHHRYCYQKQNDSWVINRLFP